ncbi:polysaccharide deacetylase [Desulfarculus baarsii DSM 2075]|uniref:Polysaccharide deacetylase n=1 Tax=Desulfarculus baarsii (strain ATCC 33931 / DSM 2075 / LMG 7858 / VKM B-1802 / 2st14) TaxID=644282 RepID=E1QLM2_DESB2|nr:polysaccharide deacetylase family protein [Desulfarculus baarsii]ADK86457.1 polysaccharide deacetylase [Desulfarculus baarsii DSM 2075]
MKNKKLMVAKLLDSVGVLRGIMPRDGLSVLCYHRVAASEETIESCAYDSGVYSCTSDIFKAQIAWLKNNTNILSLDGLLKLLRGELAEKGPYSLITFDDAYQDVYSVAYPLLKQIHAPSILFAPSKLVEEGRLGWWDMVAFILKQAKRKRFDYDGEKFDLTDNITPAMRYFLSRFKQTPYHSCVNIMGELAALCEVDLAGHRAHAAELMTWDQITEVARNNFAIGSHTHTHRVLTTITPEEQMEELASSKAMIEKRIARPVLALAYPVGGARHFDAQTKQLARQCGYEVAFSFGAGKNTSINDLDRFNIHRFEPARQIQLLAGQCALPGVFLR